MESIPLRPRILFRANRILLLLVLLAGASLRCLGQQDIDFSVAPPLIPSLADTNANTAPPTTVSIDLLAPQRSFTYDGTGSNIEANSLDPNVRVDLLSAESQTDTAIRDSVQTGQISPYVSAGAHPSSLFSRSESTTDSRVGAMSEASGQSTGASANFDNRQSDGADFADASSGSAESGDQVLWGTTSASSWGARLGARSSGVDAGSQLPGSGDQFGGSLSADRSTISSSDAYRSRPAPSIGWKSVASSAAGPTSFGASATDRFLARPAQSLDASAGAPTLAGSQTGSGSSQQLSFGRDLTFAPASEASASSSSSPFPSLGSADFLQPNIMGAASRLSLAPRQNNRRAREVRSQNRRQGEDDDEPLDTSSSNYGLKAVGKSSRSSSSRGKGAKRTNPYLTGEASASDSSSN